MEGWLGFNSSAAQLMLRGLRKSGTCSEGGQRVRIRFCAGSPREGSPGWRPSSYSEGMELQPISGLLPATPLTLGTTGMSQWTPRCGIISPRTAPGAAMISDDWDDARRYHPGGENACPPPR